MSGVVQIFNPARHSRKQLEALGYKDGDLVCFTGFYPVNDPRKDKDHGCKAVAKLPHLPGDLERWAKDGRGVYLVVNSGGHGIDDIKLGRAIFYEYDRVDAEQLKYFQRLYPGAEFEPVPERDGYWYVPADIQKTIWQHLGLPEPTFQVDTGGKSIHSYWTFHDPTEDVQAWRQLQTDLLNHARADKSLKNQNRVMRFAGFPHAATGTHARICGGKGNKYGFDFLRDAIPSGNPESAPAGDATLQGLKWKDFDQSFRYPIREPVPLEACISKDCREWLAKGVQSDRNEHGYRLATELLGVSADLAADGQVFDGDPHELFLEYCRKCPSGDGWNEHEWALLWKSAQGKPREGALSPDKLQNCVKSWAWRNVAKLQQATKTFNTLPSVEVELEEIPVDAKPDQLLRIAIANYNRICDTGDRFQIIPLRRQIAKKFEISASEVDDLAKELNRGEASDLRQVEESVTEVFGEIELRSSTQELPGVLSGFYDFDAMTQGVSRGALIIPAGRPAMGKTAWSLQWAYNVAAMTSFPVAVFSLEMSIKDLNYRWISSLTGIESGRLRAGKIASNEWDSLISGINKLSSLPIFVDDTPAISVAEIQAKLRRLKKIHGQLGMVFIDYLQLMAGQGDNRVIELSNITRALKGLARELDVPIVALSQLSRGVESRTNKRPMMSDLRDSGGLEQDADIIVMLYREEYYDPQTPDRGIAELIITKHRNGPVGTVRLIFEPAFSRFLNLSEAS